MYRETEDAVLHRLELAMQAFFRRCKRRETAGFPRFKPSTRRKQLMFPHGDRALTIVGGRVIVPGLVECGSAEVEISNQTRHKSLDMVKCYTRPATIWKSDAAFRVGL